jgi:rhodanese-related sulfurtransferase
VAFLPRLIGRLRKKPMLTVPELKQRLENGDDILLLDVRTSADFVGEQGHIAGATNVPLEELAERIDEIADYQEKPIVIMCRTDRKSAKAAQLLAQRGFADVHVVANGMTGWNENGYPLAET